MRNMMIFIDSFKILCRKFSKKNRNYCCLNAVFVFFNYSEQSFVLYSMEKHFIDFGSFQKIN